MFARPLVPFAITALAFAAGCRPHIDPSNPEDRARVSRYAAERVEDELEDLDATEAQKQALAGLEKPVVDEAFRFMEGQPGAKQALIAEWNTSAADPAKVHAIVDERVESLRKVLHAAADAALKLHGSLTAEQRAEFLDDHDHAR